MHKGIWTLEDARTKHVHSVGLSRWLVNNLYVNTRTPVYDFGCGRGRYVAELRARGLTAMGFEGTPGIESISYAVGTERKPAIIEQDITLPMTPPRTRGTVLCIEVMEHIDMEYEHRVLRNLVNFCSRLLIISWAVPGQPGHGHVNCRENIYVKRVLLDMGFHFEQRLTVNAREAAVEGDPYCSFFKESLMVFKRASFK